VAISSLARPKVQTITATGGTVYDVPVVSRGLLMRVHKFTSSDDFEVSAGAGLVEYLIQAGGGGGGGTNYYGASGGGAGGLLLGRAAVDSVTGTYAVVVGNGGNGGTAGANDGSQGSDSSAFGVTATGGGGGDGGGNNGGGAGGNGGSGGGGYPSGTAVLGQGTSEQRGAAPATTSAKTFGGGLNYESDFDGTLRVYARKGEPGFYSSPAPSNANVKRFEYGAGGYGAVSQGTNIQGGAGTEGIVIIRYPVRSL